MSFISSLFGGDKLQADGDALDAQLKAYNAATNYDARLTPEEQAQVKRNLESGKTGDVNAQIDAAFKEGLNEGAANVTGFLGGIFDFVGKGVFAVLRALPWWVWLGALAYLLFTTGIAQRLLRRAAA